MAEGVGEHVLRFDDYGFAVFKPGTAYAEEDRRCHQYSDSNCKNSNKKWKALKRTLENWDISRTLSPQQLCQSIKHGVPNDLREELWNTVLGTQALKANASFDYQAVLSQVRAVLVDVGVSEYGGSKCITKLGYAIGCEKENTVNHKELHHELTILRQIMLDVDRSFPTHRLLMNGTTEGKEGRASLFRVLAVYAQYNTLVSYCQGMSYIAGMFLMNMKEEDAFWCLVSLFERPKYLTGYFDNSLSKIQKHAGVFERIMKQRKPALYKHMEQQGVYPLMYLTPWFMALYTSLSSWDTVLFIWDMIILKGVSVIFQVALALLEGLSDSLMATADLTQSLPLLLHPSHKLTSRQHLVPLICSVRIENWEIESIQAVLQEEKDKQETRSKKRQHEMDIVEDNPNIKRQKTTLLGTTTAEGVEPQETSLVSRMVDYIATPLRQAIFGAMTPSNNSEDIEMVTFSRTELQSPPVHMAGCCSVGRIPLAIDDGRRPTHKEVYSPSITRSSSSKYRRISALMSPVRRSPRIAASRRMPLKAFNTSTSTLVGSSARNHHAFKVFNTPTPLRRAQVEVAYSRSAALSPQVCTFSPDVSSPDVELVELKLMERRLDFMNI